MEAKSTQGYAHAGGGTQYMPAPFAVSYETTEKWQDVALESRGAHFYRQVTQQL